MFGARKKKPRRRSEVRLGAQTINFQTAAARASLPSAPVIRFRRINPAKLAGLLLLAALGWVFYSLFTTPSFFVYGAEMKGNQALSAREIYAASGIDSQSVFWLNPAQIAAQIASHPNIKSAAVSVALPNRVTIQVVERRPSVLWQTGEAVWWVDEEGTVVPPRADVEDMLKIIDDDMQPVEAGSGIDSSIISGAQALRLLAPDVSVIRHTRAQGLIVATPEGWPVFLGDGSQIRAKLVVLGALLPDLRNEENPPLYIDLRDPLRPVYKLKPAYKPVLPARRFPPVRYPPGFVQPRPIYPPPGYFPEGNR